VRSGKPLHSVLPDDFPFYKNPGPVHFRVNLWTATFSAWKSLVKVAAGFVLMRVLDNRVFGRFSNTSLYSYLSSLDVAY
jgi:hypothetical protein